MDTPTPAPPPAPVLILCTDLIFSTKITGTAKALGVPFVVVRTLDKLQAQLETVLGSLLIVDLNADGIDAIEAIHRAKACPAPPRIIAFLSHVQVELAAQARAAGADQVLARSAFTAQLPQLLATPPQ